MDFMKLQGGGTGTVTVSPPTFYVRRRGLTVPVAHLVSYLTGVWTGQGMMPHSVGPTPQKRESFYDPKTPFLTIIYL